MLDIMCVYCGGYLVDGKHNSQVRCIRPLSCFDAAKEIERLKDINEELTVLNNNLIKSKGVNFDTNTE